MEKPGLVWERVNPLPNDKILHLSKFKAFADDNSNMTKTGKFECDTVEHNMRKVENADFIHFLLFSQCFQKFSFYGSLKVGTIWGRVIA